MKTKPFDLQEAIQGKPVVNHNNDSFIFGGYNKEAEPGFRLVGWVNNLLGIWHDNGQVYLSQESPSDLLMVVEEKKYWVNVYKDSHNKDGIRLGIVHLNESSAYRKREPSGYISTISILV